MKLTGKEVKRRLIKFWSYMEKHPDLTWKHQAPHQIYRLVEHFIHGCPACSYFKSCTICFLHTIYNMQGGSKIRVCGLYCKWSRAKSPEGRALWAGRIVKRTEKWNPEKEG